MESSQYAYFLFEVGEAELFHLVFMLWAKQFQVIRVLDWKSVDLGSWPGFLNDLFFYLGQFLHLLEPLS